MKTKISAPVATPAPLDVVVDRALIEAIDAAKVKFGFDRLSPKQQAKFEAKILNRIARGFQKLARHHKDLKLHHNRLCRTAAEEN